MLWPLQQKKYILKVEEEPIAAGRIDLSRAILISSLAANWIYSIVSIERSSLRAISLLRLTAYAVTDVTCTPVHSLPSHPESRVFSCNKSNSHSPRWRARSSLLHPRGLGIARGQRPARFSTMLSSERGEVLPVAESRTVSTTYEDGKCRRPHRESPARRYSCYGHRGRMYTLQK